MSRSCAANTGIGAGPSSALPAGGEGLPRTLAEQLASYGPQRVRALGRATRSEDGSECCQSDPTFGSLARDGLTRGGGRRRTGSSSLLAVRVP